MPAMLSAKAASIALAAFSAFAQGNTTTTSDTCVEDDTECSKEVAMETIKVVGFRLNPIATSSQGSYTLDQDLLRDYNFGNGNLNDILGILPGVQYSETANSVDQVSNIKPGEVSISGSEGFKSGYSIDGVNNNSRLSTGNAAADRNLLQDVSGHSQEVFINLNLLEQVEVFDANIPAKYGQFSGGLVNARTKDAGDTLHWGIDYRSTQSDWVTYNEIISDYDDGEWPLLTPTFEKQSLNLYLDTPILEHGGLVAQFQYTKADETLRQLSHLRTQQQTNYNGLVKYHHQLGANDLISISYLNAPYQGQYFDLFAANSDYTVDGGGQTLTLNWQHQADHSDSETTLSLRSSDNSKKAPNYRLSWNRLIGKDWGINTGSQYSVEGGYGDIDKTQQTLSLRHDSEITLTPIFNAQHQLDIGFELSQQRSVFDRKVDSIIYSGAISNANIMCGSYRLDCVETILKQSIEALENELGRTLDLTTYEDFILYQQNIVQAGQYFQTRQVSPASKVEVAVNSLALYGESTFDWSMLNLSLGLRYDYNDFFKQHNLAPRVRGAVDLFNDQSHSIVFGLNRYYEAQLTHYKLNQAMEPIHSETRRTFEQQPQQWQAQLLKQGYRYSYTDTKTPFSDELTLAYRMTLLGGTLEAKFLGRNNRDSINRRRGFDQDGQAILYGDNSGSSRYQRLSLSWMASFENQHLEINLSKASNSTSRKNFDGAIGDSLNNQGYPLNDYSYDDSELVFLNYLEVVTDQNGGKSYKEVNDLITRHDLELEQQDFNRPIIANISWGGQWKNLRLSAHARYLGEQDVLYATSLMKSVEIASSICNGCVAASKEFPVYQKGVRPAYWLINAGAKYQLSALSTGDVTLSVDIENLLNQRTYQVAPLATGTELGRRFWLGLSYQY